MAFETTVTEIAPRIFRISQPAGAPGTSDAAPGVGRPFTNNAYLVLADSPLLYLTLYKGGAAGLLNAIDTLTNGKGVKYVALTVWANDTVGGLRKVLDKYGAELLATPALFEKYAGPKGVKRVKVIRWVNSVLWNPF